MATYHFTTAGPNKFDLMLSIFEGKSVVFTLDGGGRLRGTITELTMLDREEEYVGIRGTFDYMESPVVVESEDLCFYMGFHCRTRVGICLIGQDSTFLLDEMYHDNQEKFEQEEIDRTYGYVWKENSRRTHLENAEDALADRNQREESACKRCGEDRSTCGCGACEKCGQLLSPVYGLCGDCDYDEIQDTIADGMETDWDFQSSRQ